MHESGAKRPYTLRVNGIAHTVTVDGSTPLLHVLRNDLGLKAAKAGCDAARQCGACAVLCDGVEIPSCSTGIAEIGNREITTPEGIGTRSNPTRVQLAFYEEQASQCGYCIPGMIIAATALLARNPDPTTDDIKAALDRHICRCGTHPRIIDAVKRAASGQPPPSREIWPEVTTSMAVTENASIPATTVAKPEQSSSDAWLSLDETGRVTAFSGKVDMGTGVRTALAQIVAEELDVDIGSVAVVMSDTARSPDQGKSTASCGVMIGGQPLRIAASAVRAELIRRASKALAVEEADLDSRDGAVYVRKRPEQSIGYAELAGQRPIAVPLQVTGQTAWGPQLSSPAPLKPRERYRYVGTSVRRDVVADHILGTFTYVHNVVLPGMLHGRVVRPPDYFARLISVDERSVEDLPGVKVVRRESFLGVVAEREEIAIEAARRLKAEWARSEPLYDEARQFTQIRQSRVVAEQTGFEVGDVRSVLARSERTFEADFHYGYQLHAMIGASCAVADVRADAATIWSGTQSPDPDRRDIAHMLGMPVDRVRLIYREAAGSYGRLGCDDAAADAALMSHLAGRPVRVQWTRRDELGWAPVGTAMTMKVEAALGRNGRLEALDYTQWTSTHASAERGSHVAWKLIGTAPGYDRLEGYLHGLHYELENKRGRTVFIEPTFRTIYLRGPGSVQSHFAIESSIDELADLVGEDPVDFRLKHLAPRDQEVLRTAARLADWRRRGPAARRMESGEWLPGRGVAYTRSGYRPTRVAVIIDVRVNGSSGAVAVDRVFVAHDCGYIVNPDGVLNQVQGNVIHALSRALFEEAHYTRSAVTTLDWERYPVIRFRDVPEVKVELIQRLDQDPSVVGETSSIPVVGAVANAIFDATGRRLRVAPFTTERVRGAIRAESRGGADSSPGRSVEQ